VMRSPSAGEPLDSCDPNRESLSPPSCSHYLIVSSDDHPDRCAAKRFICQYSKQGARSAIKELVSDPAENLLRHRRRYHVEVFINGLAQIIGTAKWPLLNDLTVARPD